MRARVCVFDSLQRKLDGCWITWDRGASWLILFADMSNDIITQQSRKVGGRSRTSEGHPKVKGATCPNDHQQMAPTLAGPDLELFIQIS